MKTYQDYLKLGENEIDKIEFWTGLISDYQGSDAYKAADRANAYYKQENPDIVGLEKWIYDMQGNKHPDTVNPNHKIRNGYYPLIIDELVSHVISNGVSFKNQLIKDKLGNTFDDELMDICTDAKNSGCGYGFWNGSHLIKIPALEFAPCYDEYTGDLAAGVRFYQIDSQKPLTMTVYEKDGYTIYLKDDNGITVRQPKTGYNGISVSNQLEGIYSEINENYDRLPIIPLYNINKQSAIIGNHEILICLDIINSTLVNNVSQGELIYWVLKNYGGMDELADANFIINFIKTHMVHVDGDGDATPHTLSTPFEANDAAAARLKSMLFENMRGVNVESLSAGNLTATYINAAYTRMRESSAKMEAEIRKFIYKLFKVVDIPESETFTFAYNEVINASEEIDNVIKCIPLIGDKAATEKAAQLLGMIDKLEEIEKDKLEAEMSRMNIGTADESGDDENDEGEENKAI